MILTSNLSTFFALLDAQTPFQTTKLKNAVLWVPRMAWFHYINLRNYSASNQQIRQKDHIFGINWPDSQCLELCCYYSLTNTDDNRTHTNHTSDSIKPLDMKNMYKITDLLPRYPTVSENSLMSAFLGLKILYCYAWWFEMMFEL